MTYKFNPFTGTLDDIGSGGTGSQTPWTSNIDGGGYSVTNSPLAQNSQSGAYGLLLSDANKMIFHPSSDATARTWTIPANSSVAFPIGTMITFVNQHGAGVITIAITSDTMRLAGTGTTGSRTLATDGIAVAMKIDSTNWLINGQGLT